MKQRLIFITERSRTIMIGNENFEAKSRIKILLKIYIEFLDTNIINVLLHTELLFLILIMKIMDKTRNSSINKIFMYLLVSKWYIQQFLHF